MPDPIELKPGDETPKTETSTQTSETTTTTGPKQQEPPPAIIADDSTRKVLGILVILQFLGFVSFLFYLGKSFPDSQMVLGAEISFVSVVLSYYFGSSSGSTAKSAMLEKK